MNINPHAESRLLRELSANAYRDIKNGMDAAKREGMEKGIAIGTEKGIQQGAQAKALEVARKMKAKGLDEEMISEMSGLSAEVIKNYDSFANDLLAISITSLRPKPWR